VAVACDSLERVFCYSDSAEILHEGHAAGATPIERPADVSGDTVTSEETVRRFLADHPDVGHSPVMMIQCTSPFLRTAHLTQACDLLGNGGCDSVIAAAHLTRYLGYEGSRGLWTAMYPVRWRRQDYRSPYWIETGAFYLAERRTWEAGRRFGARCAMVEMSLMEAHEIDEEEDLVMAEIIESYFKTAKAVAS